MGTYAVTGDVEWRALSAMDDVVTNSLAVAQITANVRKAGDKTATRSMPGICIDGIASHELIGVPEYRIRYELACESAAAVDQTGETVAALAGILRDMLNGDDFVAALNDQQRGIVFHDVREGESYRDDDEVNKIRRLVIQVDGWCYPGRAA